MTSSLTVTPLYAGICGCFYFVLCLQVVRQRRKLRVSIGDGTLEILRRVAKDPKDEAEALKQYSPLMKAIRSHGNFSEYVPFILLLLGLLELNGVAKERIHYVGIGLVASRLLHHIGLTQMKLGPNFGRFVGTLSSFGLVLGTAIANIYVYTQK